MQKVLFFHNFLSCLLVQGITTMRKYDLVLSKAVCEKTDYALKIFLLLQKQYDTFRLYFYRRS